MSIHVSPMQSNAVRACPMAVPEVDEDGGGGNENGNAQLVWSIALHGAQWQSMRARCIP